VPDFYKLTETEIMMPRDHKRPTKISLVLADVDGTLVTKDKILTDRAIAAVRQLRERGIRFAITSGRPPKGMAMLVEPLDLAGTIAGFNGGQFADPDMKIIEERTLPPDIAKRTAELILDNKLDCWVYAGEDWFIRNADAPHVAREAWTVKFAPRVIDDLGSTLAHAVKIVGVSDDQELVAKVEKAARDALGDGASAARSQPYYLDVTHPQANKGAVVEYLSQTLNIPAAEFATLGDMPNDTLMFRKSGLAIAMGQSSKEVQDEADLVTTSYEDEGFAHAIERFVLAGEGTR
jgi:Cof subfamily protein (haloacid dehalogenase superfamily)